MSANEILREVRKLPGSRSVLRAQPRRIVEGEGPVAETSCLPVHLSHKALHTPLEEDGDRHGGVVSRGYPEAVEQLLTADLLTGTEKHQGGAGRLVLRPGSLGYRKAAGQRKPPLLRGEKGEVHGHELCKGGGGYDPVRLLLVEYNAAFSVQEERAHRRELNGKLRPPFGEPLRPPRQAFSRALLGTGERGDKDEEREEEEEDTGEPHDSLSSREERGSSEVPEDSSPPASPAPAPGCVTAPSSPAPVAARFSLARWEKEAM